MAFTNTSAALRQVGGLVTRRLAQGLQENNAVASGSLEESITFRAYQQSSILGLEISMLDYWEYVDEGRKAGRMPPVSKIREWLTYPNVREKLQQNSDKEFSDIDSKAFAITKKIGEKGTKGTDFATNVFNSKLITKEMPALIESALGQDLEDVLDKAFNIQ